MNLAHDSDQLEPTYHRYKVYLASTAGPYAQYDGPVTVFSPTDDQDELFTRAVRELGRTSFPDRTSKAFWRFERAEKVTTPRSYT